MTKKKYKKDQFIGHLQFQRIRDQEHHGKKHGLR